MRALKMPSGMKNWVDRDKLPADKDATEETFEEILQRTKEGPKKKKKKKTASTQSVPEMVFSSADVQRPYLERFKEEAKAGKICHPWIKLGRCQRVPLPLLILARVRRARTRTTTRRLASLREYRVWHT